MTDSDLGALMELSKRAILHSVSASAAVLEEIIADTVGHIEQGLSSAEHIFLKSVNENEVIVGFILLKNGWNLCDLYVEPGAQGQGVGKALFLEALSMVVARENRGYVRVNSSRNAEGFYRGVGFVKFVPEKEVPDFVVPLIYWLDGASEKSADEFVEGK